MRVGGIIGEPEDGISPHTFFLSKPGRGGLWHQLPEAI